jgi:methyltransferase (TIGR00027 family)
MKVEPDSTAVRVALWRALHLEVDAPPHIFEDAVGLRLADPGEGWRSRPDMNPVWTQRFRAGILSRSRFIEDLVVEQAGHGVEQYVLLGAGLDTFVQRRPEMAERLRVFEIDQPGASAWKRQRLVELGFGVPDWLRLVPVDFEINQRWLPELLGAGFDPFQPSVVASAGVSMYLSRDANEAVLREAAILAGGSTVVMSFLIPIDMADADERAAREIAERGARESGTPFLSHFWPYEIVALAERTGLKNAQIVSTQELAERYFANRTDGLRPSTSEQLLLAET